MHGSEGAGQWQHWPATRHCEGFEGTEIAEYSGIDEVVKFAEFVSEHGKLGGEVLSSFGNDLGDTEAAFEHYAGKNKSLADFAAELTELGGGWNRIGKTSGNPYVSLTLATLELGPPRIYAYLGRAAGQDDGDTLAILWNPRN